MYEYTNLPVYAIACYSYIRDTIIYKLNYLAHSVLSFNQPDLIIGNFIADSVKGNRFEGLTPEIIKGIILHRKIDVFTDAHPVFLDSKHRFREQFGKYSGVLTDIIYDHFLAKNFEKYSPSSLQDHANSVYSLLQVNHHFLPEHAQHFYKYMTQRNVLVSYADLKGIETVLEHLSHRIRFHAHLNKAIPLLETQYEAIEQEFFIFFDEMIKYCLAQDELNG